MNNERRQLVSVLCAPRAGSTLTTRDAEDRADYDDCSKELILESVSSILIGIDERGRVNYWNTAAEETFGIERCDILGRKPESDTLRWDWPVVSKAIVDCQALDTPVRVSDVRYARADETEAFLGITLCRVEESRAVLIQGADISERRRLEQQLRQAQRLEAIGQLAAGIAHEINTPTQYVGDNTRFLQECFGELLQLVNTVEGLIGAEHRDRSPEDLAQAIKAAIAGTDLGYLTEEIPRAIEQSLDGIGRVGSIVRAMREFAHPGTEEKQPVDLNRAIESTITVARSEWKYVAEMVTDLDPNLSPVTCLPGEVNQVILNLLVNAAHAVGETVGGSRERKGAILVSTRDLGDSAEICVADTGAGIPEEIRSRVFDPFFTTKEVGKGTGQGLSIAYGVVVKKHGGTISVESEVGKGSRFRIRLPKGTPPTGSAIESK